MMKYTSCRQTHRCMNCGTRYSPKPGCMSNYCVICRQKFARDGRFDG